MVWGEQSANNVDSSEKTNEFGFARVMIIELLVGWKGHQETCRSNPRSSRVPWCTQPTIGLLSKSTEGNYAAFITHTAQKCFLVAS